MSPNTPIFYDPKHRRWPIFLASTVVVVSLVISFFAFLFYLLLQAPSLPELPLQLEKNAILHPATVKLPFLSKKEKQLAFQLTSKQLFSYFQKKVITKTSKSSKVQSPAPTSTHTEMVGFYVNWDDTSLTSLKKNISSLDVLMPEWLHYDNDTGQVTLDDVDKQERTLDLINQTKPDLKIVPLINNVSGEGKDWETDRLEEMLADPAQRHDTIQSMLQYVQEHHFAGIVVDFENLHPASQKNLTTFMSELSTTFHAQKLEVGEATPVADTGFEFKKLAQICDYLVITMYDEHSGSDFAGPVASQEWFTSELAEKLRDVPANKLIIGIGNYGYDWQDKKTEAEQGLSFQEALITAKESQGQILEDPRSLNMTFDYYDENDQLHHVWFLDAVTAFNQFQVGEYVHPKGWALWRLGSEDPSLWSIIDHRDHLTTTDATQLQSLHYGYDIDYEGKGEVLRVTASPQDGKRVLQLDPATNLITQSSVSAYPSPYVITRWGFNTQKKLAITFDDGPSPQYTESILNILKQYHVSGTFFVIGANGDQYPQILSDMVKNGNEVGVHTYTHPNISTISHQQLALELNATEQLFESRLGIKSLLFRPPYAEDIEPVTPDQVKPLIFTSQMGYYTIGMQIDPSDWSKPGVDKIVSSTIQQVEAGNGNVILLHDGGGDRSQTIAALPLIIQQLEAKGYQFVPVSDLLGLRRDDVMPPLTPQERFNAQFTLVPFGLLQWFWTIMSTLFVIGVLLGVLRLCIVLSLSLTQWYLKRHPKYKRSYHPSVSLLVPAYNEEKVIVKTVRSLLNSDYDRCSVIVINDGSSDKTLQVLKKHFGRNKKVKIITTPNQGKAAALNTGIKHSRAEIVIMVDADTHIHRSAVSNLVRHFIDKNIGAVAGNAKVGNRHTLLTRWQALEYLTSQNLDRRAFALLNCITVVPGAIGAWRRKLVKQVGGFARNTLAEDADLTLSILERGYSIAYEPQAVAYTEAPDQINTFLKQRFRWTFGTLQVIWKHKATFLSFEYPFLSLIALPNLLIFQIFFPLVSPVMDLLLLDSFVTGVVQYFQHPLDGVPTQFFFVLFYYLLFLGMDFITCVVAFSLEKKEDWKLLFWVFWQRFLYRQLMYYIVIKSILVTIRGSVVGWNKLERHGMTYRDDNLFT